VRRQFGYLHALLGGHAVQLIAVIEGLGCQPQVNQAAVPTRDLNPFETADQPPSGRSTRSC
jgi:hypothetical protein